MDKELFDTLTNSPSSSISIKSYVPDMTAGNILYWGGIGLLVSDLFIAQSLPSSGNVNETTTIVGLLIGGIVISFVGINFIYAGYQDTFDAIWQYNKDIISGTTKVTDNQENLFNLSFSYKF
jgi:hypothetical protein